ncbi:MAG TPA: sulfotransferase [Gammaproteobacteria bacterium]|nr:sulfotransferase [Gammaproteobacteria bacterium]
MSYVHPDRSPHSATLYKEALDKSAAGDLAGALHALENVVAEDPGFADAYYQRGNVLRRLERPAEAAGALREALRLKPDFAEACFSLVFLLRDEGRLAEIETTLCELADALPADAERLEQAAGLLAEYGRFAAALAIFERAARVRPDLARLQVRIGQTRQKLGHFAGASDAFGRAIELDPLAGPAYLLLAHNARAKTTGDPRLDLYTRALAEPGLEDNTRSCLHFALGKLQDDLGNYTDALTQFQAGNAILKARTRFDRATWQRYFRDLQSVLPLAAASRRSTSTPVPVFIIGMPRSGTTLAHRLLSNHSAVHGLGETGMVDGLVEALAQQTSTPYPQCLTRLRPDDYIELAAQYRARWPREAVECRYVLDKNPLNFLHVGLILRLFPDALLIHCERDPRDVAVSIYSQYFAHPRNAYAYDFADIGFFYAGYRDLMQHWLRTCGNRIRSLNYEQLIAAPETEMRSVLEFMRLDWEPGCLDTAGSNQSISTASVWQARQPLYADSVGRWRHYASALEPFVQALPPLTLA